MEVKSFMNYDMRLYNDDMVNLNTPLIANHTLQLKPKCNKI